MVTSTLDVDDILGRAKALWKLESETRPVVMSYGSTEWAMGDMIKSTLDDVASLVAEVETLRADLAKREHEPDPLRSALIGILRADGYEVTAPVPSGVLVLQEMPRRDGWGVNVVRTNPFQRLQDALAKPPAFNPDAAASDMLGEDAEGTPRHESEMTDREWGRAVNTLMRGAHVPPRPIDTRDGFGPICPNCEQIIPEDGKCRSPYVDCQKVAPPLGQTMLGAVQDEASFETIRPLENGAAVRIVGSLWDGRYAVALGTFAEHSHRHCVQIVARGAELTGAQDIEAAQVFVVNPTVDDPIAKTGPVANEKVDRKRAPEPPKLVTEWAPDGRDFKEYAKELPISASQLEAMLPEFRQFVTLANPDQRKSRWGGVFKDWAKARLAST